MSKLNRRAFLKSTAGLIALAGMDLSNLGCAGTKPPPPIVRRPPKGPNERLNVAIIGLGGRSSAHISPFNTKENCRIVYVCDPDTARTKVAIEKANKSNDGIDPQFVQDLRRVIDDKDVDIVSIASTNHWHSLASIWAMQAGKDVYVEKPLSHTLLEGRRVVQIAQRSRCICQHGSQMRSNPAIIEAMKFVHGGALGKVLISRALCYKPRQSIGQVNEPQRVPETVDYNLWCGPAPMQPLLRSRFHYDWHWFWETGNGDIGNQGIHEIDLARWALGTDATPTSVQCVGGRFGYADDGETPNTQVALFGFGEGQPKVIVEVRGLPTRAYHTNGVENVVECENGYLVSPSYSSAIAYDRDGNIIRRFEGSRGRGHFGNFLDAVRSRRAQDLTCPPIEAHRSCAMLHMANISYLVGRQERLDSHPNVFNNQDADRTWRRTIEHLAGHQVNPAATTLTLGRRLEYDAKTETFKNARDANSLRTRAYRKPFEVPERV